MARVAVFIASPAEIKKDMIPAIIGSNEITICYTGLGKVRAAVAAYEHLSARPYDLAINLGTCGSHSIAIGQIVEVRAFVERDVDLSAVGIAPGFFPGAEGRMTAFKIFFDELPNVICGSGDCINLRPPKVDCDVYDMEAFALAFVCKKFFVPLVALKVVSDASDENSGSDWKKNLAHAQGHLISRLHKILNNFP